MFTNGILKHLVERPRPWLTVEGLTPLIAEHDPNSFPSGHTSASFAAAVGLVPHSAPPVDGGDGGGAGRPDGLLTAVCRSPLPQ
ncbi:MAG: phosphatase PAP2 family protein [Flavonifractor plautii]